MLFSLLFKPPSEQLTSNYKYRPLFTKLSVSLVGMNIPSVLNTRTDLEKGLVDTDKQQSCNAFLLRMQKAGEPPFSSIFLVSINQYIQKPKENIDERFKLNLLEQSKDVEDCDSHILHNAYITMGNICFNASNDLLRQVVTDTELRIIFNHFVSLLKYAISRKNKGIIIDEECLNGAIFLMCKVFESLNPRHAIVEDFLKSLAGTAKSATKAPSHDSGVGYFLCLTMITCYTYSVTNNWTGKIASIEKKFMTMHKTGIMEQVLRHIYLPWAPLTNNNDIKKELRFFFITIASSTISLSKMFKAGSPARDALVDVLEGRIKPCEENEHMMEILEALKKFLDLGLTSGNPDDQYISTKEITCAKCGKEDSTRKMLACGSCKRCGYCSRECQVAHWKDHKPICKRLTAALKNRNKLENCEAIVEKFLAEHKNSIFEAMRKIYDGGDLVLDLDFSNQSSPALPPAFRNPPEFDVLPADVFWNREKDKAPPGHWFFEEESGSGTTRFSDEDINEVRKEVDFGPDHFNLFVFLKLSVDNPGIYKNGIPRAAMKVNYNESEERRKNQRYQQERSKFIQRFSDELLLSQLTNPEVKDLSASEKQEHVKKSQEFIGKFFDMLQE